MRDIWSVGNIMSVYIDYQRTFHVRQVVLSRIADHAALVVPILESRPDLLQNQESLLLLRQNVSINKLF